MIVSLQDSAKPKQSETLILFATEQDSWSKELAYLDKFKKSGDCTGKKDEVFFLRGHSVAHFQNTLVIGLGDKKELHFESYRRAAGLAYTQLTTQKCTKAAFDFDFSNKAEKSGDQCLQACAEGFFLGAYSFDEFKKKSATKNEKSKDLSDLQILTKNAKAKNLLQVVEEAQIISDATNLARRLGDLPGNKMTPSDLAEEAKKAAKGTGIKVTVWDRSKIKAERFGGLLGVSLGSSQEPRFIIMEYKGATSVKKKPIILVGKGLTFDSGGVSIKPAQNMDEMKYDMCGGANVIAALLAIAKLKLKVNVTAMVPATENMTGPSANKPGDILTARNGLTMEVLNTDAEGRLILADALAYASEQKPAIILDAATLTGAIIIALGNSYTGTFTRDDDLWKKIESSAKKTGEPVWRMPLNDHHVKDIKSDFADLANISSFRGAGSSTAAAFLEHFVDKDIPWAHFDIAGSAWNCSNRLTYVPKKGATGAMVRTFVQFARDHF